MRGCCYWEVECNGDVGISVSYKHISRKGMNTKCLFDVMISPGVCSAPLPDTHSEQ